MANDDLDLDVKAHSVWDYVNENKKVMYVFVWIWRSFVNQRAKKMLKQIFILVFVANLVGVSVAYFAFRNIIDGLVSKNARLFLTGLILLGVLLIISRIVNSIKNIVREYFLREFGKRLNAVILKSFFEKSLGTHTREEHILNESNIRKGRERLLDMVYVATVDAPDLVVGLSIAFVMIWLVHPVVALIMTVLIIVHLGLSGFVNYRIMVEGNPIEKMWRFLYRYMAERLKNIERVKTNAKGGQELQEIDDYYDQVSALDLKLWIAVFVSWSKRGIVSVLLYVAALGYGFRAIWLGRLSTGWVYPMIALSTQIFDNLWKVGDLERRIHYNLPSVITLKEAVSLPIGLEFRENAMRLPRSSPCGIEFDAVSYKYGDDVNTPFVLNNVSFTIEPNEKVAIIGISGVGKSTLMKLLLRDMDSTSGMIRIDGHDLKDIDMESWLNLVGYIPQQSQILNGTVRYNALYGLSAKEAGDISDEYLWEQARMLQVDFGERLTDGLDTKIGERGIKLSGGQNQRLMILSAVMKDPRFMIIDEATSSLDSSTEKLVQAGLEKVLSRNCGALIIAHRLSSVRRMCDKFVFLEPNGSGSEVVAIGKSFEELAEMSPQFRKLASDQEVKI